MDSRNPLRVGASSSLIELKSELIRKQRELEASKSRQKGVPKTLAKSKKKLVQRSVNEGKKNAGVDRRNLADEEEHARNEKTYEKARSILEAKAKLYDQMSSDNSVLMHDRLDHPVLANSLVDFQQKAIEKLKESKSKQHDVAKGSPSYTVDEDEMVEFVDSLGRTRRCHRSTLAKEIAADQEFATQDTGDTVCGSAGQSSVASSNPSYEGFVPQSSYTKDFFESLGNSAEIISPPVSTSSSFPSATPLNTSLFMTEEQVTEMKHQKWNEESDKAEQKDSVHYQDVLFDEVRTHGVSYFGFSSDEQQRHEQIRDLKMLSEQTKATRDKVMHDRNSKASKLKERLKKIRARKRARLGLPPKDSSSDESDVSNSTPMTGLSKNVPESQVDGNRHDELKVDKPASGQDIRPWDFGKPGVYGPKPDNFDELDAKWLKERREDRNKEFAPPSIYSDKSKLRKL